jgi:hypothetical protein
VRVRELVTFGRAHLDAGRREQATADLNHAMALDPACEEAAESLWAIARARPDAQAPADPTLEERVAGLLARVGNGTDPAEARRVLAELSLLAPDDPRVVEASREKAARAR